MPARAEVLRDGTIGREEALGLAGGLEPLHAPLPLAGGLVRVLGAIIEITMLPMFHPWEELSFCRSVAPQVSVPPAKRVACWVGPSQRRQLYVKTAPIDPLALVHECSASRLPTHSRPLKRQSPVPRNARP